MKDANVHQDLQQLSYGLVKVRSYGRYDVNGFRFRSTQFEALRPLAATTNTEVVTRAIDAQGRELIIMGSLTTSLNLILRGIRNLMYSFLIVIGLITIIKLDRTSLA